LHICPFRYKKTGFILVSILLFHIFSQEILRFHTKQVVTFADRHELAHSSPWRQLPVNPGITLKAGYAKFLMANIQISKMFLAKQGQLLYGNYF